MGLLTRNRVAPMARTAGVVAVAILLASPAVASAGMDVIVNGPMNNSGVMGPRHSLSSVWTTWYSGQLACANAWNDDGSGWAGATVCASSADTNKGHLYCACKLRRGVGFSSSGISWAYVRQFW